MLEYWKNGFWDSGMMGLRKIKNQCIYRSIDFLIAKECFQDESRRQKMDV
jgi:hypothetical protein